MVARDKTKNNNIPPGYLMLSAVFFQLIWFLGGSIILVAFKIRYGVLGVSRVDT